MNSIDNYGEVFFVIGLPAKKSTNKVEKKKKNSKITRV